MRCFLHTVSSQRATAVSSFEEQNIHLSKNPNIPMSDKIDLVCNLGLLEDHSDFNSPFYQKIL